VYDTVAREGWGSVTSRDCGNIVKKAIEMRKETSQASSIALMRRKSR